MRPSGAGAAVGSEEGRPRLCSAAVGVLGGCDNDGLGVCDTCVHPGQLPDILLHHCNGTHTTSSPPASANFIQPCFVLWVGGCRGQRQQLGSVGKSSSQVSRAPPTPATSGRASAPFPHPPSPEDPAQGIPPPPPSLNSGFLPPLALPLSTDVIWPPSWDAPRAATAAVSLLPSLPASPAPLLPT